MKHVVIVGAGISGLATAYHIRRLASKRAIDVTITILECGSRSGGRGWTERVDGFQIEVGATGFLDSKRSTLELCHGLGLADDLVAARPEAVRRYVLHRGCLEQLPTSLLGLLSSRLLSWPGKMRLL